MFDFTESSLSVIPLLFRIALLCTSSDILATRKLCGFKGQSAFPGSFGENEIILVLIVTPG